MAEVVLLSLLISTLLLALQAGVRSEAECRFLVEVYKLKQKHTRVGRSHLPLPAPFSVEETSVVASAVTHCRGREGRMNKNKVE